MEYTVDAVVSQKVVPPMATNLRKFFSITYVISFS